MKAREPVKYWKTVRINANLTGDVIDLRHVDFLGIQLVWTGSGAAGTFYLKGSVDGTNYTTMKDSAGTDISSTASGAGSQIWDIAEIAVPYAKITFANSAGDGYVSASINTKSSGA